MTTASGQDLGEGSGTTGSVETRRVAVLMGGISPEHPVSLASGCGVFANMDRALYEPFPVLISRDNVWIWPTNPAQFPSSMTVEQARAWLEAPPEGWQKVSFDNLIFFPQADVFFLALHGVGGEDGTLQAYLESIGQPFTGSGSASSRTAMDKIRSKELYRAHGVPTAPWIVLRQGDPVPQGADRVERELGLPAVVKHPAGGSSIGVAVVKTRMDLEKALAEIGTDAPELLVEAFIPGREATCGVLEGFATPMPPTEIRPKKDAFFSFEEKYQQDGAEEITPAAFPAEVNAEIQRLAAVAHAALGLSVYSRTDFIWTGSALSALETNNLPGMTPKSILPQQAACVGLSYRDLVTRILETSLEKG
jgi:D-alanine-D-alanine ligase